MKKKCPKLKILLLVVTLAVLAFAKIGKTETDAFSSAEYFPSGALVYAQFQDLPALLKLWNDSNFKQDYLSSANYQEFSNSHLALKLVGRFAEYNEALGFPLDSAAILSSSDTQAAFAVYDIGRMEMVFVAPMGQEQILASLFFQNSSQFEETVTADEFSFYKREFEVDRGREKQTVLFANVNGYFVLATNKKMFLKTLENISGKRKNENLFDEPTFRDLTKKVSPHHAVVWVNQEKLNNDWYFKHYWLMDNPEDLQKIRAGIFDFEIGEEGIFERRVFLKSEDKIKNPQISAAEISEWQSFIPEDAPFYKIEAGFNGQMINDVLFDEYGGETEPETGNRTFYRHYYDEYDEDYYDYYNPGSKFSERINEIEEDKDFYSAAEVNESNKRLSSELEQIFTAVNPKSTAYLIEPQNLPDRMFFDCRKAVIFHLQKPQNLNREKLENVISEMVQNRLMLGESKEQIVWKTLPEASVSWRELSLPMLRWKFYYAVTKNRLVISNSAELSSKIFKNSATDKIESAKPLDNLTVIRLDKREQAFDEIMKKLRVAENKNALSISGNYNGIIPGKTDFFVDNIGSLLDVSREIKQIEIRRSSERNYLFEELKFEF